MKNGKKAIWDLIYSIAAVGLMNVVLQFAVYPFINREVGEAAFGEILSLLGVLNILAPSFGLAVNNTRLVLQTRDEAKNRDFLNVLALFMTFSVVVAAAVGYSRKLDLISIVWFAYIVIISILRNYASVDYRLSLNYKKQFIFYVILSVGYIAGMLLFLVSGGWYYVFAVGETAAVMYVVFTGNVLNQLKHVSSHNLKIMKDSFMLAGSYLLTNIMMNLDRFVLLYGVNSSAVSQYYVLSLMGKTVAIISGPLNSVLIGYITKTGQKITRAIYKKTILLVLGLGTCVLAACAIATPIFIKLFYASMYEDIIHLNMIVNLGQILYFLTNILLIVILTFTVVKWQLVIQSAYSILFVVLSVIGTLTNGLYGYAVAALISNGIYFVMTAVIGWHFSGLNKTNE